MISTKIDKVGRVVIPRKMLKQLGIELESNIDIELEDNKIVITNKKHSDFKQYLQERYANCKNEDMKRAFYMILEKYEECER